MRVRPGFFLAEALKNLRLNPLMSVTAVTTTFICILVFGLGLLVSAHIQGIIDSVREDVSVEAFMPNTTRKDVVLPSRFSSRTRIAPAPWPRG
jgi:cell division transport system permease protein